MTPEGQMGGGAPPSAPPPQADAPPQQPSQGDSGMDLNNQVRQLIMQIGVLAQRMPEASPELQAAAKALTMASQKLLAGQREPQGGPMPIGS